MAKLEFVDDGDQTVILVSGDLGSDDQSQDNECAPLAMDRICQRGNDTAYYPQDCEKCYVVAVYDRKIVVEEFVFKELDLAANAYAENSCLFKTREEAEHIAEVIERETNGEFFIDRRGGGNATFHN